MLQPIFIDSSCFIYAFEGNPTFGVVAKSIFSNISKNKLVSVSSIITLSEILVIPYKDNNKEMVKLYQEIFSNMPNFSVLSPNWETAIKSAEIRAKYNFNLRDSYQLAMAQKSGCKSFITNDKNLTKFKELKVILLSELEK